jgi:hypothetical protein
VAVLGANRQRDAGQSSNAAFDVSPARFGLSITRAMRSSRPPRRGNWVGGKPLALLAAAWQHQTTRCLRVGQAMKGVLGGDEPLKLLGISDGSHVAPGVGANPIANALAASRVLPPLVCSSTARALYPIGGLRSKRKI